MTNWIFNKKELPNETRSYAKNSMRYSYGIMSMHGNLVLGMSDYRTDTVFINLPLISNTEQIIRTIEHEMLHIVLGFSGKDSEEEAIERLMVRIV